MKSYEWNIKFKRKLLFLLLGSGIGTLLLLQYFEPGNISFSLQILNTNIASLNELRYRTSTKQWNFQQKQLHEDSKVEHKNGIHQQRPQTYTREVRKIRTTAHVTLVKAASNIETTNRLKTRTTIGATTNITNIVPTRIILFYTSYFGEKPWGHFSPIKDYNKTCGCSFDGCEISSNNNDYSRADIVFFHARNMPSLSVLKDLKKKAKRSQYWMYFVKENPYNTPPVGPLNHLFELAMSYRYNSDFIFTYGRYVKRTQEEKEDYTLDVAKTKSKQIAWMVSHCGTRRDKLAKYFEQHGLIIAVGGSCASQYQNKLNCATKVCIEEMSKYKFYFSAENNLCNQYITEKYWSNPFKINAVPIVLGGSNYSDPQLAIPGSFISALDFKTPKDLVEYIKKVDSNDTLYNSYFNWKKYFKIFQEKQWGCSYAMCNLCDHLKRGIKVPKDILYNTIYEGSECGAAERHFDQWIQSA